MAKELTPIPSKMEDINIIRQNFNFDEPTPNITNLIRNPALDELITDQRHFFDSGNFSKNFSMGRGSGFQILKRTSLNMDSIKQRESFASS